MKRVQHTQNNSETKKLERLISDAKYKEKSKKIEQFLILGIVMFCLSLLYFVVTTSNSSNGSNTRSHNVSSPSNLKENSSKPTKTVSGN
jgi:maltodextrin utilization protein YvdJ